MAIALVKADGFELSERAGQPVYTARISFSPRREPLYLTARDTPDAAHALASSFHYEGYNFDSAPRPEFLRWALTQLQTQAHQIEGVWFTGGITDPAKTDLYAEYLATTVAGTATPLISCCAAPTASTWWWRSSATATAPDIKMTWRHLGRGEPAQTWKARRPWRWKQWEGT